MAGALTDLPEPLGVLREDVLLLLAAQVLEDLSEVLLRVRADLGGRSRSHVNLHLLPVLPEALKRLHETLVLRRGPATVVVLMRGGF